MTITRIKPAGWANGERLTATQMNDVDTNVTNAIDKRAGALEVDAQAVERVAASSGVPLVAAEYTRTHEAIVTAVNTQASAIYELRPYNRSEIGAVAVGIKPAGAHAGLPASMPTVELWEFDMNGISPGPPAVSLGTVTDTSASVVAYEAYHLVILSGLSAPAEPSAYRYFVEFKSESGANALAGCSVYAALLSETVTELDEAQ